MIWAFGCYVVFAHVELLWFGHVELVCGDVELLLYRHVELGTMKEFNGQR